MALLFKNAPDLMNEFRDFLPEITGSSQSQHGLMSIMPHPSGSSWNQNADSPSMDTDKPKTNRRRKRVAEKEPAVAQKAGGRVCHFKSSSRACINGYSRLQRRLRRVTSRNQGRPSLRHTSIQDPLSHPRPMHRIPVKHHSRRRPT